MKLARMTVTVPVDDHLPIQQLVTKFKEQLQDKGTDSMDISAAPAAEGETLPTDLPTKGRIHWPAAEVVISMREPGAMGAAKRKNGGKP